MENFIKIMNFRLISMFVRLVTCILILIAVAVHRDGSIFGHNLSKLSVEASEENVLTKTDALQRVGDAIVVNTTDLAREAKGFGGPVPLEITIKDGIIENIVPLKNSETESFFNRASAAVLPRWIGTPAEDVATRNVDAVSGATLSSNAINANVKAGVAYALDNPLDTSAASGFVFTWKYVVTLLVVLCAAIIPLFVKKRAYRYIQLVVNVIVLGFWSGTFLSYELFVNYLANGVNVWSSVAVLLMLIIAFVYPYFGKKTHYCAWVCPLGSLQELCGKTVKFKLPISPKVLRGLERFQEILWFVLIFLMAAGIWFEWINYELFRAFIFESVSVGVLIAAGVVVLLSFVVARPYCRFVCPTGYLFQTTQTPDKEL